MELTNEEILKIVELYKDAISGYDFKSMERSSTGECHSCYKIHVSAQKKLQKIGFNFYQHYAFNLKGGGVDCFYAVDLIFNNDKISITDEWAVNLFWEATNNERRVSEQRGKMGKENTMREVLKAFGIR